MNKTLQYLQDEAKKCFQREIEINDMFHEYCKGKKFKIVKTIYYAGYQNDLKGRECILHPFVQNGQLLASCTVYNKHTKKIDIYHNYLHDMSFYEEIK